MKRSYLLSLLQESLVACSTLMRGNRFDQNNGRAFIFATLEAYQNYRKLNPEKPQ